MKKSILFLVCAMILVFTSIAFAWWEKVNTTSGGVSPVGANITPGPNGMTVEQTNIFNRYQEDNKVGAVKHLYVISPYSGQVILYSTVKGKVTSGSKRLTPNTAVKSSVFNPPSFRMGNGRDVSVAEIIGEDGTFGASGEYLYWWDTRGIYHQHYLTGGQIVHISAEPVAVKSIIINLEAK